MNATQTPARSTKFDMAAHTSIDNGAATGHALPEPLSAAALAHLAAFDAGAAALDARGAWRAARLSVGTPMCAAHARMLAERGRSNRAAIRRIVAERLRHREDRKAGEGGPVDVDVDVAQWIDAGLRIPRPLVSGRNLAPGPISHERQAEAMRALRHSSPPKAPHLRALLWLAMETGARANELVAARWSDFDLQHGIWKVPARETLRARSIPLSTSAMRAMRRLELASSGHDRLFHPFGSARSATRALAAALAAAGAQPIMFRETRLQALHQLVAWHGLGWPVACAILGRGVPPDPFARYAKHRTR